MLEGLWYGNTIPFEDFRDGRKEYKELMKLMASNREKLEKYFTPEQTEWIDKYDDVINEMHSIAEAEAFKYGFHLALNLAVKAMSEKKPDPGWNADISRFGRDFLRKPTIGKTL